MHHISCVVWLNSYVESALMWKLGVPQTLTTFPLPDFVILLTESRQVHLLLIRVCGSTMDVESEQSFHDLEQRYITLKKEHDLVLVDKDSLQGLQCNERINLSKMWWLTSSFILLQPRSVRCKDSLIRMRSNFLLRRGKWTITIWSWHRCVYSLLHELFGNIFLTYLLHFNREIS